MATMWSIVIKCIKQPAAAPIVASITVPDLSEQLDLILQKAAVTITFPSSAVMAAPQSGRSAFDVNGDTKILHEEVAALEIAQ